MGPLGIKISLYIMTLALMVTIGASDTKKTYCAYSKQDSVKFSRLDQSIDNDDGSSLVRILLDDNSTELCPVASDFCYALWQQDSFNDTILLTQGCWDSSGEIDCGSNQCISKKRPPKALNNTKFCCCLGDWCNSNVTDAYVPSDEHEIVRPALQIVDEASYKTEAVVFVLASVCGLAIVVAAIFIYRLWSSSRKPHPDSLHLMEAPPPNSPKFDASALKVEEVVGRGRFGSVCRATLADHVVAVKVFVVQHRQYYMNERDIYTLPHMEHPCLPDYIGCDERMTADGRPEYMLVLSFAPLGCLQEFLRHNTLDWPTLCKMTQSLTKGLSHLHTEIKKGDKVKPCVAHRDLNSRNVLVKADGSCEVCDFGFAIRICGSKYVQNGEEQVAETTSLADVGTLRYMSPEVLEGAVNLRDCETSLKQIDVYALGLVLWEIATRCSDLYQGMEVPPFRLPFEAEIGLHPSMEQMQVLVTRNKARPLFPDIWKASNPAIRLLKETIDDCWDQDAEARLTALCVEERLLELPVLWERHKGGNNVSGVSPTVNINQTSNRPTHLGNLISNHHVALQQQNVNGFIMMDTSDKNPNYRSDPCSSVSESTTDTMLTMSPSDIHPVKNNAHNNPTVVVGFPKFSVPLQPHQGRNPCMERNLMTSHSDELSVEGNTLLQRSQKDKDMHFLLTDDVFDAIPFTDNIESNVLMSNGDTVPAPRTCNPIPFVQNAVHSLPLSVMPKQPNLPGNGHRNVEQQPKEKKKFIFFESKNKNAADSGGHHRFGFDLRSFFERRKNTSKGASLDEDQQPLKGSPVSEKASSPVQDEFLVYGHSRIEVAAHEQEDKSNLMSSQLNTEKLNPVITRVCVVGNTYNTREMVVPSEDCYPENPTSKVPLLDINDNCNRDKSSRPTTLPVATGEGVEKTENGGRFKAHRQGNETTAATMMRRAGSVESDASSSSGGSGKIARRIKTPYEIKKGRFSLYDDRMMTSSKDASESDVSELNGKVWQSMPFEMNAAAADESSEGQHEASC